VLDAFRDALRAFEGSHYFHNYTRRSRYAPGEDARGGANTRKGSRGRRGDVEEEEEEMESSDYRGDGDDVDASGESDGDDDVGHVGSRASGYYWLLGRDDRDLVGKRHARVVSSFTAGDVEVARAGDDDEDRPGEPFVRVVVAGDSFVLYQIRKMIATAVGVALGWIPREFIPVTLARPARAATPIAPASTLYLREAEFSDFRKNREKKATERGEKENGKTNAVVNSDLPTTRLARLEASDAVRAEVDAFARDVLEPSLAPSLRDEEWDLFVENLGKLRMCAHQEGKDAVAAMTEAHAAYEIERKAARAAREEAEEADAATSR
jgi:tRNA pseudouridine38-40 synthase